MTVPFVEAGSLRRMGGSVVVALVGLLAFAPAGTAGVVAFMSNRCDGQPEPQGTYPPGELSRCASSIWRVNEDGSDLRRLTGVERDKANRTSYELSPAFSSDGSKIAFVHTVVSSDQTAQSRLWTMNADGSDQRPITPESPGDPFIDPEWSRDGRTIVFSSLAGGGAEPRLESDIWIINADGSGAHVLNPGPDVESAPTFTADGKRIAFVRAAPPFAGKEGTTQINPPPVRPPGLFTMALDGTDEAPIVVGRLGTVNPGEPGNFFPFDPNWTVWTSFSGDGRFLAFSFLGQLYTMTTDGRDIARRTFGGPGAAAGKPVLSGSGSQLIYPLNIPPPPGSPPGSEFNRRGNLVKLDLSVTNPSPIPITQPSGFLDEEPTWGPDESTPPLRLVGPDLNAPRVELVDWSTGEVARLSKSASSARRSGRRSVAIARDRLGYFGVDRTGIRRIDVSIAKKQGDACRFLAGRRLGRPAPCAERHYARLAGTRAWRKRLRRLGRGRYRIAFRTVDIRRNKTERAPVNVRLK